MPRLQITVSDTLHAKLMAIAERDSPGAPNLSAAGLRLLALGIEQEEAMRPLEPRAPTSAEAKGKGRLPRPGGA